MADTTAESTTFQAAAYSAQGAARSSVTLPGELFDGTVNMPVMHQAVKAYLANQRQGNAATKIRKYVIGGNQKPWKQKGTGRARQGSARAPHWVGGGTVFGPIPRSYAQYVPRQVRALARKSAFNARARENAVVVVENLDYDAPKTSRLKALVEQLGASDQKVLILTDGAKANVFLSGRNLPAVHVMPYADVSTYHILWSDVVVIEGAALGLEPSSAPARAAKSAAAEPAAPARGKTATRTAAKAEKATKPAAKKAAKATAKKPAGKKAPAAKTATAKKSGGSTRGKKGE
jgi:large subunit ribosomal protein L4